MANRDFSLSTTLLILFSKGIFLFFECLDPSSLSLRYARRIFLEGGTLADGEINLQKYGTQQRPTWQLSYRAFEFLQELPFSAAASCGCNTIIGDGTLGVCIKTSKMKLEPLPIDVRVRHPVAFSEHAFLRQVGARSLLREYTFLHNILLELILRLQVLLSRTCSATVGCDEKSFYHGKKWPRCHETAECVSSNLARWKGAFTSTSHLPL